MQLCHKVFGCVQRARTYLFGDESTFDSRLHRDMDRWGSTPWLGGLTGSVRTVYSLIPMGRGALGYLAGRIERLFRSRVPDVERIFSLQRSKHRFYSGLSHFNLGLQELFTLGHPRLEPLSRSSSVVKLHPVLGDPFLSGDFSSWGSKPLDGQTPLHSINGSL